MKNQFKNIITAEALPPEELELDDEDLELLDLYDDPPLECDEPPDE